MRHLPCFCITKWQNISHNTRVFFYQHIQENAMWYSIHQYLKIWQLWKWLLLIYSNYRTFLYRNPISFSQFQLQVHLHKMEAKQKYNVRLLNRTQGNIQCVLRLKQLNFTLPERSICLCHSEFIGSVWAHIHCKLKVFT